MTSEQITSAQCAALSGLHSNEMLLGVSPTAMHDSLHASYRLHDERGWQSVRDMIVADIRASLDLGASKQAADLLIVLRRFLSERVAVVVVRQLRMPSQVVSFPSSAGRLRTSQRGVRSEAGGSARVSRPSRN
jgi:hypothetical protein